MSAAKKPLIELISPDFAERMGAIFTHLLGELPFISNPFQNQFNQWLPFSFQARLKEGGANFASEERVAG